MVEICNLVEGRLVRRLNRFVLEVEVNGRVERAHLRDSGRLTELMKPGNRVLMRPKKRERTSHEVFVIYDVHVPVVVNSSLHSDIAAEILGGEGYRIEGREVKVGSSRIDLLVSRDGAAKLVEVKGCTLVRDGVALFPDAPTERGVKHVREIAERGGMILFLVMRSDARIFMPNHETHPEFAKVLREAYESGVDVRAALLRPEVQGDCLTIGFERYLPVEFPDVS
ncbi:sugar fermentation stimulation protein [Geoglobus ahangari]|uniref:Sugar fermentation stimulation protein homolog n=1 Tax=Geoglobus ahangari TaxID=113653 RepID=A0A0F7IGC7_9EURY|nr:DNA/RNA nuclease SfsA [Geoglobus ahangari]AKG91892.1 sugar fermentation stimulation protein [Geoglobus ahangari]